MLKLRPRTVLALAFMGLVSLAVFFAYSSRKDAYQLQHPPTIVSNANPAGSAHLSGDIPLATLPTTAKQTTTKQRDSFPFREQSDKAKLWFQNTINALQFPSSCKTPRRFIRCGLGAVYFKAPS